MKQLRHILLAVVLGAGLAIAGAASGIAQDAETTPEWRSYPVGIHAGTCESPEAQPVFDLDVTRAPGDEGDGVGASQRGAIPGSHVTVIDMNIDIAFDELLDGPQHVIAVHESPEAYGNVVACGEIGGPEEEGRMIVGLRPVNQGGVAGIAILDDDNAGFLGLGDDQVNVRVYVFELEPTIGEATPDAQMDDAAATPMPAGDVDEAPVDDDVIDGDATPVVNDETDG